VASESESPGPSRRRRSADSESESDCHRDGVKPGGPLCPTPTVVTPESRPGSRSRGPAGPPGRPGGPGHWHFHWVCSPLVLSLRVRLMVLCPQAAPGPGPTCSSPHWPGTVTASDTLPVPPDTSCCPGPFKALASRLSLRVPLYWRVHY
jgi:hypothetical protein